MRRIHRSDLILTDTSRKKAQYIRSQAIESTPNRQITPSKTVPAPILNQWRPGYVPKAGTDYADSANMTTTTASQRNLADWMSGLRQMLRFRLARRLFLVVFAAIVVIECIIVIPSYQNFKNDLLSGFYAQARTAVTGTLARQSLQGQQIDDAMKRIMFANTDIVGVSLLSKSGRRIGNLGETISLLPASTGESTNQLLDAGKRYEIFFPGSSIDSEINVFVRMNTSGIQQQLNNFLVRILGLVLIICVVSGATVFFYVVKEWPT